MIVYFVKNFLLETLVKACLSHDNHSRKGLKIDYFHTKRIEIIRHYKCGLTNREEAINSSFEIEPELPRSLLEVLLKAINQKNVIQIQNQGKSIGFSS